MNFTPVMLIKHPHIKDIPTCLIVEIECDRLRVKLGGINPTHFLYSIGLDVAGIYRVYTDIFEEAL